MAEEKVGFVTMGAARAGGAEVPTIGVGMLGYAFMGKAHSNALRKIPYIAWPPPAVPRMVAIAGRNREAVVEAQRRYGWEKAYADWRELLADPEVQLFDNGGPNDVHAEPSIAALEAGKHVLCEKPLARSAAEARTMLEAARRSRAKHACAFNYRFVPAVRLARDLITSGRLGQIYHFRVRYLQEWIMDPDFPRVWRLNKAVAGSGALGDLGTHSIDLARFLIGEPKAVQAMMTTFIKERPVDWGAKERAPVDVDDAFAAVVEFENGALGTIEASRFAGGRKNYHTFEVNGSKGSIAFDLERLNELEVYLPEEDIKEASGFRRVLVSESYHPFWNLWWPHGHIIGWEHTFVHEFLNLLRAIVEDGEVGPWGATFEDGYRASVIADAIAQSAAERTRVEIRY